MTGERLDALELPMMVAKNTDVRRTAFTVSIDAAEGTTTGISAADRCRTIHAVIDPDTKPSDLARPGHSIRFVTNRVGSSSAPATPRLRSISRNGREVPGGGARGGDERRRHGGTSRPTSRCSPKSTGSLMGTIADLIAYRRKSERLVERVVEAAYPHRSR